MKPRIPGSQVPPNLRPLHTDRKTASTHSKIPHAQAHAGELFRVRDKDWAEVWGESLDWDAANRLKDSVVAAGKSRTARVENMKVPPPAGYVPPAATCLSCGAVLTTADQCPACGDAEISIESPDSTLHQLELVNDEPVTLSIDGAIMQIPADHQLYVNGVMMPVPVSVRTGDVVEARPLHPDLVAARAAAAGAVRHVLDKQPKVRYRDPTATPKAKPNPNPPRDKTATQGVYVRLGAPPSAPPSPPPSPLKVATIQDGKPLAPDQLADDSLRELAGDVGGGASDADLEHAKKIREEQERAAAG